MQPHRRPPAVHPFFSVVASFLFHSRIPAVRKTHIREILNYERSERNRKIKKEQKGRKNSKKDKKPKTYGKRTERK